MLLQLGYSFSYSHCPIRITHLIKEPGKLGSSTGAWGDAGLVIAVEMDLLRGELLGNVTPSGVEGQPAAIGVGLVRLGSHHQQGDVDLAHLGAASVPGSAVRLGDLRQPLVQVEAALPVVEVVDQDDPVDRLHEDVPGVPLTVAPADVPELHKELLLVGSSLQVVVELHLH